MTEHTRQLFGEEGIFGLANNEITADVAVKIGQAAGLAFQTSEPPDRVLIGKDTRRPNYMIENALTAGFVSAGMEVLLTGPLPTPGIATLTRSMRADLGAMICAPQKTYESTGVILFDRAGLKLTGDKRQRVEDLLNADLIKKIATITPGRAKRIDGAAERYIELVKRTFPLNCSLDGVRIVVDCANGAAYTAAPQTLWELGAEVIPIGVKPDGYNINHGCGAAEPEVMCRKVLEMRADFGIALDGAGVEICIANKKGELIEKEGLLSSAGEEWRGDGFITALQMLAILIKKK